MDANRLKKVNAQLQQDLAEIFRSIAQNSFPGILLTVSNVRVSPDLSIARVNVSIFPSGDQEKIMDWIKSRKSAIKDQLVKKLKGQLRKMPELEFYLDDSLDYKENIERLLRGEGENPIR